MIVTPNTYILPFWPIRYSVVSSKWSVGGISLFELKYWVLGTPYHVAQGQEVFLVIIQIYIIKLSMIGYGLKLVGLPIFQKNGGSY